MGIISLAATSCPRVDTVGMLNISLIMYSVRECDSLTRCGRVGSLRPLWQPMHGPRGWLEARKLVTVGRFVSSNQNKARICY